MFTTITKSLQFSQSKPVRCMENNTPLETTMNPSVLSLQERRLAKNKCKVSIYSDSSGKEFLVSNNFVQEVESMLWKEKFGDEDVQIKIRNEFRTSLKQILSILKKQRNFALTKLYFQFMKNSSHNQDLQSDIKNMVLTFEKILHEIIINVKRILLVSNATIKFSLFNTIILKTKVLGEKIKDLEYLICVKDPKKCLNSKYFFVNSADVIPDFATFKKEICLGLDILRDCIDNYL